MATDDQDFSFPTTIDVLLPPHFMESPPLWWMTSVASRREKLNNKGDENGRKLFSSSLVSKKKAYYVQRKSFSYTERGTGKTIEDDHSDDDDEEEEKMDMLWEDYFNEEIKRSTKAILPNNLSPRRGNNKVEFKCVEALRLTSKASKMPSIVVFLKLLKKVFLLHHNSNHSFKKYSY